MKHLYVITNGESYSDFDVMGVIGSDEAIDWQAAAKEIKAYLSRAAERDDSGELVDWLEGEYLIGDMARVAEVVGAKNVPVVYVSIQAKIEWDTMKEFDVKIKTGDNTYETIQ